MSLFPSDPPDRAPAAAPPLWQCAWAPPLLLAIIGVALFTWTWQAWPDVLVDFGVQLYVPWRLAAGDVLYRDIAHYTGPLSVYYNALAFRAFGTSLRTLEFANLPILIGIIAAIYALALKLAGRLCAFVCGIAFLTLFALRAGIIGNYNYVCPYEYEYTHATLLCLCTVLLLTACSRTFPEKRRGGGISSGPCLPDPRRILRRGRRGQRRRIYPLPSRADCRRPENRARAGAFPVDGAGASDPEHRAAFPGDAGIDRTSRDAGNVAGAFERKGDVPPFLSS